MTKPNILLTPGPTPVPEEIRQVMAQPIIHHRTPQFEAILAEAEAGLKKVFKTENDVLILTSSGTGAMEASVINLLSPGDKALAVRGGKFGERWSELCQAYGIINIDIDVEWGKAVDPKVIAGELKKDPAIKAVFTTLTETSTGVVHPIKEIAEVVNETSAVLVVDAISGLAGDELKTDEWKVDVVVSGSQKGLMLPPGLAFISLSEKAWKLTEQSKCPKYYFDLKAGRKSLAKNTTPFTPAVTLVIGLNQALKIINTEGVDNLRKRQQENSDIVKAAVKELGLELFAPEAASKAVTSVKVPEGIDGGKLVKTMRDIHGIAIAGGQAHLKGKIFRIASMGAITKEEINQGIKVLKTVLKELK